MYYILHSGMYWIKTAQSFLNFYLTKSFLYFFLEAVPEVDSTSESEAEDDGCVKCLSNKEDDQVYFCLLYISFSSHPLTSKQASRTVYFT